MAKDSYYFSHDANAQEDPKCILLIEQLGMEAYGIFWALVERLRHESSYRLPLTIIPALSRRWNTSREKVEAVIKNYGLFKIEDELFFSERLNRSMLILNKKRKALSDAGKKGNLIRWQSGGDGDPIALKESKGNKGNVEY